MTLSRTEAVDYCQTLLAHFPERLSEWEDTFVRSVLLQLRDGASPTEKQGAVLDRIMDRVAQQHGR